MSLKRRDIIAWILLVLAALGWTYGLGMMKGSSSYFAIGSTEAMNSSVAIHWDTAATTHPVTYPVEENSISGAAAETEPTSVTYTYNQNSTSRGQKWLGFILCFAGAAAAAAAVFFLWQKNPLLGPDAALLLLGLFFMSYRNIDYDYTANIAARWFVTAVMLLASRELWGWLCARLRLSWCMVSRLAERCKTPQLSLLVYAVWSVAAAVLVCVILLRSPLSAFIFTLVCILAAGILGICCLWKYGTDLHHFKKQLDNFQNSLPVTVKDGSFAKAETQLRQVQTQHKEAVRTAVTSERFKVELIANVSHDLRTPLTSILGYGELLQKESLSPAGQEQLQRLNQKAGYMKDLVESLFELTKVSSGVMESKREEIDLIRLLEQTIGLFDDQLTAAGLLVRRHYETETVPVITDGARMHQVFANLLGNAIKYALAGTRIHLEVKESAGDVTVRMINTSFYEMDFQPEEIMQRFARGDKARSTKGSGLGLAIAQTYTESVGGEFRVAVDGDQFSAIVRLPKTEQHR